MAKEADHGVSILHTAPFHNGVVTVRFKMHDRQGLKFNFNDPNARTIAHAGHVCSVGVSPTAVTITDQITCIFKLDINEARKAGKLSKEQSELLKIKTISAKTDLKIGEWYQLEMVIRGDLFEVYINGEKVTEHKSEGYDHKFKDNVAFAVSSSAEVDDIKVYSLD